MQPKPNPRPTNGQPPDHFCHGLTTKGGDITFDPVGHVECNPTTAENLSAWMNGAHREEGVKVYGK